MTGEGFGGPMEIASLDDFMALNDQLAALISAGVPLQLGLESLDERPSAAFERINATVARRVSRGASLAEALGDEDPAMPAAYRNVMLVAIESGEVQGALDAAAQLAQSIDGSRRLIRGAFFYPVVVCILAAIGLAAFFASVAPRLESLRKSMRLPDGNVERLQPWLLALGVGVAVFVLASATFVLARRLTGGHGRPASSRIGPVARLLGGAAATHQARCAAFAKLLSALSASARPLEESLPVAAEVSGDAGLRRGAEQLAAAVRQGDAASPDGLAAAAFPPFLRWALLESAPAVSRPRALAMAADVYRQSARRRADRLGALAPAMACVVVGGGVVLLYGLTLFLPIVDLLKGLSLTTTN
jgi:general secretion pathway protein F